MSRNKPYIIQSIYNEPSVPPQIPEIPQEKDGNLIDFTRQKIDINNNTINYTADIATNVNANTDAKIAVINTTVDNVNTAVSNVTTIVNGTDGKIDSIAIDIDGVSSKVDAVNSNVTSSTAGVTTNVNSHTDTKAGELASDISAVNTAVGNVDTAIGSVDTIVNTIDGKVDTVLTNINNVDIAVGNINSAIVDVDTIVNIVNSSVDDVNINVGDVSAKVDAVNSNVTNSTAGVTTDVNTHIDEVLSTLTQYKATSNMSAGALVNLGLDADGNDACLPASSATPTPLTLLSSNHTHGLQVYGDSSFSLYITIAMRTSDANRYIDIVPEKQLSNYTVSTGSTFSTLYSTNINTSTYPQYYYGDTPFSVKIDEGHFAIGFLDYKLISSTVYHQVARIFIFSIDSAMTITKLSEYELDYNSINGATTHLGLFVGKSIKYLPTTKNFRMLPIYVVNADPRLMPSSFTLNTSTYTITSSSATLVSLTGSLAYNDTLSTEYDPYHFSSDPEYDFNFCFGCRNSNAITSKIYKVNANGTLSETVANSAFQYDYNYSMTTRCFSTRNYIFAGSGYQRGNNIDNDFAVYTNTGVSIINATNSAAYQYFNNDYYATFVHSQLSPTYFIIVQIKNDGTGTYDEKFYQISGTTATLISTNTSQTGVPNVAHFYGLKYRLKDKIYWFNPSNLRDAGFTQAAVTAGNLVYVQLLQKDLIDKGDPNCAPGTIYKSNNTGGTVIARGFKKGQRLITANFYDLY